MNTQGSIERRTNGTFRLIYSFGRNPVTKAYRRVRVSSFATSAKATSALSKLNEALEDGVEDAGLEPGVEAFLHVIESNGWTWSGDLPMEHAQGGVVSLHQLCIGYLDWRLGNRRKGYEPLAPRSYNNLKGVIDRYLGTHEPDEDDPEKGLVSDFGRKDYTRLKRTEVEEAARSLSLAVSSYTANRMIGVVRPALDYAMRTLRTIGANPAAGVGKDVIGKIGTKKKLEAWNPDGTLKKAPDEVLTPAEVPGVLAELEKDPMWYSFFATSIDLGARLGAVAAAKLSDLHQLGSDYPSLIVKGGITYDLSNKATLGNGKDGGTGEMARAGGCINRATALVLKAYVESDEWKQRAKKGGDYGREDAMVFRTQHGEMLHGGNWNKPFREAVDAVIGEKARKKRKIRPNSCRHIYITAAKDAGVSASDIAQRVDNSAKVIEEIYYHGTPERQKAMAINVTGLTVA